MLADMAPVDIIGANTTILLPCAEGDYVFWVRGTGLLSDASDGASILDFWEIHPGDHVAVTNRADDLPPWFQLHPSEARGSLAFAMIQRVHAGEVPEVPLEGPNLWRVMAGDRLVWTGKPRAGYEGCRGVLKVFDFAEDCLVIGEPGEDEMEAWITFGAPHSSTPSAAAAAAMRNGVSMVVALGCPQTVSVEWGLG